MKDVDIIKAIAELDGFDTKTIVPFQGGCWIERYGDKQLIFCEPEKYLTSRDAIVPVIEKHPNADSKEADHFMTRFQDELLRITYPSSAKVKLSSYAVEELMVGCYALHCMVLANPSQLCEALLRATGKWKD